jgi:hypothetical protein
MRTKVMAGVLVAAVLTTVSLANDFTQGTFYPSDTYDVAVIVLDEPSDPGAFAALPTAGRTLPMMTDVDIVGYGVQGFIRGGGRPGQLGLLTRYFAPSQLIQSNGTTSSQSVHQADGQSVKGDGRRLLRRFWRSRHPRRHEYHRGHQFIRDQ